MSQNINFKQNLRHENIIEDKAGYFIDKKNIDNNTSSDMYSIMLSTLLWSYRVT